MLNGHFENEIKQALTRVSPPDGFAERVLDRLSAPAAKNSRWQVLLAIAAMIVLGVSFMFYWHYQQEEREHIQKAQQQLAFALRLTAKKLTVVDARLKKSAPQLQIKKAKEKL